MSKVKKTVPVVSSGDADFDNAMQKFVPKKKIKAPSKNKKLPAFIREPWVYDAPIEKVKILRTGSPE